jgi:hypothetical protein
MADQIEPTNHYERRSHEPIITIRLIKSFEYRNVKNLILKNVDLKRTASDLKQLIKERKQQQRRGRR